MIVPVDIRHYSKRILDALIGTEYDQDFLTRSMSWADLTAKQLPELEEAAEQKGLLIMHSNAVRELTSMRQIIDTLSRVLETMDGKMVSRLVSPTKYEPLRKSNNLKRENSL